MSLTPIRAFMVWGFLAQHKSQIAHCRSHSRDVIDRHQASQSHLDRCQHDKNTIKRGISYLGASGTPDARQKMRWLSREHMSIGVTSDEKFGSDLSGAPGADRTN